MAGASLLTLLDDIATILDDVAVLSKVATKKTAGVLGDDLALNAEQVSGVKAERELPVVWAVAKGSFLNKLILVPAALLISSFMPSLITYLLIIGGVYLCYEGAEKIWHSWQHKRRPKHNHLEATQHLQQLATLPPTKLIELERAKIKGAIRTDFVLSAEIIVIILGTLQTTPLSNQIIVLSFLAIAFTIGVYGLVAMIVKIDDAGLWLLRRSLSGRWDSIQRATGRALLRLAPMLMKTLGVVGTIAMFLVGGGILSHSIVAIHHLHLELNQIVSSVASILSMPFSVLFDGVLGIFAGILTIVMLHLVSILRGQAKKPA